MPMNPRLLRPSGQFDPRRISGLTVWMDTLTPSTYDVSSGQVTTWRNKAGSLQFTQSTANNRPTLFESSGNVQNTTQAVINGRQAFYFDGTNDALVGSATITGTEWTAFAVCRADGAAAERGIFNRDSNPFAAVSARGPQLLVRRNNDTVRSIGHSTSAAFFAGDAGTVVGGVAFVAHAVQTASELQAFFNNVGGSAVSGVQNTSANTPTIGNAATGFNFWLGTIGEILYYSQALTTAEQTAVHNYLKSRWGIA